MSLSNLSISELQDLLMEETKKFTVAMRDKLSQDEKDSIRKRIEDIQKLLEEKKHKDNSHIHISH